MSNHIVQFSVFTAAVLEKLYDSFPLLVTLEASDIIEQFDVNKKWAELDKDIPLDREDHDFDDKAKEHIHRSEIILNEFKENAESKEVFGGTIDFLISEGYMRCNELYPEKQLYRDCQLTAKGFAHLHMEFKDKSMRQEGSSFIRWIKSHVYNSSTIEGAIIVNVISKFLG